MMGTRARVRAGEVAPLVGSRLGRWSGMVGEEGGPVRENDGKQASASERDVSHARERDKSWLISTYAGHSTAAASNALSRKNLARGQTGLSVAFDLPTQSSEERRVGQSVAVRVALGRRRPH